MKQAVDPYASFRELTLRGMILGALITVDFYGFQRVSWA